MIIYAFLVWKIYLFFPFMSINFKTVLMYLYSIPLEMKYYVTVMNILQLAAIFGHIYGH